MRMIKGKGRRKSVARRRCFGGGLKFILRVSGICPCCSLALNSNVHSKGECCVVFICLSLCSRGCSAAPVLCWSPSTLTVCIAPRLSLYLPPSLTHYLTRPLPLSAVDGCLSISHAFLSLCSCTTSSLSPSLSLNFSVVD